MIRADFVIVGSGLTGSTIARILPDHDQDVLILDRKDHIRGEPSNFEEACLAKMPYRLYEHFIKGYTEKQWGVKATELDKELAVRITINKANINTLTPNHRWNALPRRGYTEMVRNMLD